MLILLVVVVAMLGSATKLKNTRNIKLQGAVSGNTNFDGSKDIVIDTEFNDIVSDNITNTKRK